MYKYVTGWENRGWMVVCLLGFLGCCSSSCNWVLVPDCLFLFVKERNPCLNERDDTKRERGFHCREARLGEEKDNHDISL
jgi:hypothetical protein